MNLRVLKKSRHIPQAGDIFVMQLPDTHYLFGRVINTKPSWSWRSNFNLYL